MSRIAFGFHPKMDGTYPYGGFPDDTSKKHKPVVKIKKRKPRALTPGRT